MHSRTLATLDRLHEVTWFNRVGVRDTEAAEVLSSWKEAVEHCSALEWSDLRLEAVNQYCNRLRERAPDALATWNERVMEIKPLSEALVREKAEPVRDQHQLGKKFVDVIRWDVLHVCMEAEYADVFPPGFYASQAYWYTAGHFPCGWRGAFPEGKLVIY